MGSISKAALFASGYLLGARAGTARYQQILHTARTLAARPELQPYLGELARRLPQGASTAPAASPPPKSPSAATTTGTGTPSAATEPLPGPAFDPPEASATGGKTTRLRRRATS